MQEQQHKFNVPLVTELSRTPHEPYPQNPLLTGHRTKISHPGLWFITNHPQNPHTLTPKNNPIAYELSARYDTPTHLVELVSQEIVSFAIKSIAKKIEADFAGAERPPLVVPILNGGTWLYRRLQFLLPELIPQHPQAAITIQTTFQDTLAIPQVTKHLPYLDGQDVILVEDLLDRHNTVNAAAQHALEQGAGSVRTVALVNKIHPGKQLAPEVEYVGFAIPNLWIGGAGADFSKDHGRHLQAIYAQYKQLQAVA